ncbi:MAG: ABC transporter substrate-binding protein [Candidatus Rokubacteria bacterium]|nr:ABC transporter substrate-binding protein [Candidatus Rokubacteria bacterium]
MKITVMEPFRSLFYAPQFVALHGGGFAAEGRDVTGVTADGSSIPIRALAEGRAQFSMGGVMRSLDVADRGGRLIPHFAEVNSRNGFFLLARQPRPDFAWRDLAGRTVISFAGAPTPWQCMLTVLRREGVDPARVTFVRTLPGADAVAAFRAGRGDFLEAGQPTTEALLAEGAAHLVVSMGEATGPVPFSSYMTTPDRLRREPELVRAFTRAVYRAQRWIARHGAAEIAGLIAPSFADIPAEVRVRVVERYLRQSTWAPDPILRRPGFEYLHDILLNGGFIKRRHRYEDLVDTGYARQVVETLKEEP